MAAGSGTRAFNQVQVEIASKAMKDAAFRKELLANPKATLEREMRKVDPGLTLPATLQVHVHEQGAESLHLTVPAKSEEASSDAMVAVKPVGSITSSDTWRKTLGTWDCGCL